MRLFNQRKRQEEIQAAEAAGESLWTPEFDSHARVGIWQAFVDAVQGNNQALIHAVNAAHGLLIRDEHVHRLAVAYGQPGEDLSKFLHERASDRQVASVVEALALGLGQMSPNFVARYERRINDLLQSERIAYELVNSEIVELSSQELHTEVVAPALRLLSGRAGWQNVERAYQQALRELADGRVDNAITDAGSALQESLSCAGAQGRSLGPLISDARKRGILGPHDSALTTAIEGIMDWVSADRSQRGDGHRGASPASREDAWLTVHVVGALILRLASGGLRES